MLWVWFGTLAFASVLGIPAVLYGIAQVFGDIHSLNAAFNIFAWMWFIAALAVLPQQFRENRQMRAAGRGRRVAIHRWLTLRGWRAARAYNAGTTALQHGDFESAVMSLGSALGRRPEWPEAWNNLGLAAIGLADNLEAVGAFTRAIELRADFPEAHNNLGKALVGLGNYRGALAAFEQAIVLRPDYAMALENRTMCLQFMDEDERR